MEMKWSRTCTAAAKTRLWPAGAGAFLTVTRGFGPAGLYSSAVEWTLSALGFFCDTCPLTLRRTLERLPAFCGVGHCGGTHGISAGQFDRSSAHRRIAISYQPGRRLLEDVYHRHPAGCDSVSADLLSPPDREISVDLSQG